jgi:periplasmic protein TonB
VGFTMSLRSFLLISVALHAAALTYPAVFFEPRGQEPIAVVVLNLGDGDGGGIKGDGHAEGKKSQPGVPKRRPPAPQARVTDSQEKAQPNESRDPMKFAVSPLDVRAGIAVVLAEPAPTEVVGASSAPLANGSGGEGGSGGQGISGAGNGFGIGLGDGSAGSKFVQVSYAYSPKPQYPDRARREGKEGRVLLRVLVDEEGRAKSVEVNRSSGSEALDRAAAEVIKRWRFSPARYSNQPVESWVKIPIDFRLTDATH